MSDQLDIFATSPYLNEHGVMDESQAETLSDEAKRGTARYWGWTIKVAKFPDGQWRAAPDYTSPVSGFSWPLSTSDPGYPDRDSAIRSAAVTIQSHLAKEPPTPLSRRILADMAQLNPHPKDHDD